MRRQESYKVSNGSFNGLTAANHHNNSRVEDLHDTNPAQSRNKEDPSFVNFVQRTAIPLFLMFVSPNLAILLWYTATRCDGSFALLYTRLTHDGVSEGLLSIWADIHIGSTLAVCVILAYMAWALLLMYTLPGPHAFGPVTPNGNIPVYRDNGFACFVVTIVSFCALTVALKYCGMSPTIVYDHFDEFLGTLTVFTHILCILLHLKGLLLPSSSDCGTTGNLVFDYYWGTELYPRVAGIDIKVFTNCRFGMTVWALLVLVFAIKNYELYGFVDGVWVSTILQMAYFGKFFWWESGYMQTIDIMLDRAGFYICWGCLAFIPGVYASVSMCLATHATRLGTTLSLLVLAIGMAALVVNYVADVQKQNVRGADGHCAVWGKPALTIRATYWLETGERRESLLLVSGWWGVARHFHYVPELILALCWTLPAGVQHVMPYTYFLWLCILLVHRTYRDDAKCGVKYGRYWEEYCRRVPYKMIPGVF